MSYIPISEKIMEHIHRMRGALPRPDALDHMALHPGMLRSWLAELVAFAGYNDEPSGKLQFMGIKIIEDSRLPVNRMELRAGPRVLGRVDISLASR